MHPALQNIIVVMLSVAIILALSRLYFQRVALERPPVGVYNLKDILILMVFVVVLPPLYLKLPPIVVMAMMGLVFVGIVQFTLSPILRGRPALYVALAMIGCDMVLYLLLHKSHLEIFLLANNVVMTIGLIGVSNMYAQCGMRAREVAIFAGVLMVYDLIATTLLPLMTEFSELMTSLPLMPIVGWGGRTSGIAVGLGDLIIVSLWPLVAWKAFGRRAGIVGAVVGWVAVGAVLLAFYLGVFVNLFPVMIVLGPLVCLQYLFWKRRFGVERTTVEFRAATAAARAVASSAPIETLAEPDPSEWVWAQMSELQRDHAGKFVALWEGQVLGVGVLPGEARVAARKQQPEVMPFIVRVPR